MDFDPDKKQMVCMLCSKKLESIKLDTIKKQHKSKHCSLDPTLFPSSKKRLLVMKYEADQKYQKGQIQKFLDSQMKDKLS